MSSLNSGNGVGNWTLLVQDTAGQDHLGYYSATLSLNAVIPEPGTLALLALGSVALTRHRRRVR